MDAREAADRAAETLRWHGLPERDRVRMEIEDAILSVQAAKVPFQARRRQFEAEISKVLKSLTTRGAILPQFVVDTSMTTPTDAENRIIRGVVLFREDPRPGGIRLDVQIQCDSTEEAEAAVAKLQAEADGDE